MNQISGSGSLPKHRVSESPPIMAPNRQQQIHDPAIQGGYAHLQVPDRRLVVGEIHGMPIRFTPITITKYMCHHTMARLYLALPSGGLWLKEPCIFDPA